MMRTKIFLIICFLLSLKSCKKENMDDDFAVFVGEWKCENRYIHQTYLLESVDGTAYEHTLHIYSNGKFRISLPDDRDNKGRIREIRHVGGGEYNFEFVCNFFNSKRIIETGWYETFYHEYNGQYYFSIKTSGEADYLYIKVN